MIKYIIRRLVQSIPIFFGITLLSYLILWLAPGDPIIRLYFAPNIKAERRAELRAQLGVDDPFHIQYLRWLIGDDWLRWDSDGDGVADRAFELFTQLDTNGDGKAEPPGSNYGILRGDFGNSFVRKKPVIEIIAAAIPATLELSISALIIAMALGIPIGVISAAKKGSLFDNVARVLAVVLNAVPNFWLGLILILFFGAHLGVFPLGGRCGLTLTGVCPQILQRWQYLVLPAIVLAGADLASFSRYLRTSTLDVLSQDYIRTAKAKGLSQRQIDFRHALRNALIPFATLLGPILTNLWGGAAVIETVFAWPGVGRVFFNGAIQQDYPVVMGIVIISAVATILGLMLSDILYVIIDPRIRLT